MDQFIYLFIFVTRLKLLSLLTELSRKQINNLFNNQITIHNLQLMLWLN